jgi:hypothetical protein
MKVLIPAVIAALMLFAAVANLPYDYFILLRWIVTVCAAIIFYAALEKEDNTWMIIMGAIAILFNPIWPVHLTKTIWIPIDIAAGILFIISIFFIKLNQTKKE